MRRIALRVSCVGCLVLMAGCPPQPNTGENPQMAKKSPQAAMLEPIHAPVEGRGKSASEVPRARSAVTQPSPPVSRAKPLPPSQYAESTPAPAQMRVHVVQPKETLFSIARRYYADEKQWRRVFQANRNRIRDPNRIEVGMKLIIP